MILIVKIPVRVRPLQVHPVTAETIFTLFPDGQLVLSEPGEQVERKEWYPVEVEINEAEARMN